jgi:uncharacterized membrane protein
MKKNTIILIAGTLLCFIPLILFLTHYNQLPAEIPIQFSFTGKVNNTAPKDVFIFAMPVVAALLNIYAYFKGNRGENKIIIGNIVLPILFLTIQLVTFFMVTK